MRLPAVFRLSSDPLPFGTLLGYNTISESCLLVSAANCPPGLYQSICVSLSELPPRRIEELGGKLVFKDHMEFVNENKGFEGKL